MQVGELYLTVPGCPLPASLEPTPVPETGQETGGKGQCYFSSGKAPFTASCIIGRLQHLVKEDYTDSWRCAGQWASLLHCKEGFTLFWAMFFSMVVSMLPPGLRV